MIKLIVSDVDGTLVEDGSADINPELFEVILKLREKGIQFAIASGRPWSSVEHTFDPVKKKIFYISNNGSYIGCHGRSLYTYTIDKKLAESEQKLETVQQQLATAQEEVKKPFPKETELNEKMERLSELNALLNMDEKGNETILADEDIGTEKIPDRDDSRKEEVQDADRNLQETADKVHKPSILERLKQEKARQLAPEQTGTAKPKKNYEQEL